jgi:zinc protease
MRNRRRGAALAALFALFLAPALSAAPDSGPVAHRTLANGLEVFVVENHAVPLATVCIVFRGGAVAQDPETAGIFHLYEHMLFDGNEKYPTQDAFIAAMNKMGVPKWNGATGGEYIYYYITVPSDKAEDGVEFWSWAAKKPVFDAVKLEKEKQVVLAEIRGYHVDPDQIAENALESRMFPAYPWRKNIDGPEANVEGATVEQLRAMKATYYIPANAALMLAGDLSPEQGFAMAERHFGDWEGGKAPIIGEPPQGALPEGVSLVYPDDDYYDGVANVQYRWRGPDVMRQTKDTYTADVLLFLLTSPVGAFKSALMEKGPGIYDPEYIDFGYPTSRDGGAFQFSAYLTAEESAAEGNILDRAKELREVLLDEFELIAKDPASYFAPGELEKAKAKLIDQNILAAEVASSFATGTLVFWWSVATTDYYFGYEENCSKVSYRDISDLIRSYLLDARAATAIRILSDAYASDPKAAEREAALEYESVGADNAFWWQE